MLTDPRHYDAAHTWRTDDVRFFAGLVTPGLRVLELGCGTGRIAIPMAQAGARVTAIDVDAAMVEHGRTKYPDLAWHVADMRSFEAPLDQDLVVLAFNAINLLEPADALGCLVNVKRHLAPGGRLVIDTMLPTFEKIATSDIEQQISAYRVDDVDYRVTAKRRYDPSTQRRRMELAIYASGRAEPEHDAYDFHVYFPSELQLLVERAGFAVEERFGGFDRSPLSRTSQRQILVCAIFDFGQT